MAKELPYFKFEPAEYLTKDISFCSLAAQGLFINICAYYWQRECKLTKQQLLRRLNHEDVLNELIEENIIVLEDNDIIIDFLDRQLTDVKKTSKINSINGSKGGRPKKQKPKETQNKPNALNSLSQTKGIREDKIRIDKTNNNNEIDVAVYDDYIKQIGTHQMWSDAFYMKLKLSKGSLSKLLNNFKTHLQLKDITEQPKDLKNFKSHFVNWCNVQDRVGKLAEYKKHKSKTKGAL